MLVSMTGYGSSEKKTTLGHFRIEMQSWNRKFLEVDVDLPSEFLALEPLVRKVVSSYMDRGKIAVRVLFSPGNKIESFLPEEKSFFRLKTAWDSLAAKLKMPKGAVDLSFLMRQWKDFFPMAAQLPLESLKQDLEDGITAAVKALLAMRKKEGAVLEKDLLKRIHIIDAEVDAVEKKRNNAVEKYRERLKQRLEEFAMGKDHEAVVAREIALLAEKVDITEELVRVRAHLAHFGKTAKEEKSACGRKLEFLLQEIGREIHTIGSKSQDIKIAEAVIAAKSEIEKIREQLQNIE